MNPLRRDTHWRDIAGRSRRLLIGVLLASAVPTAAGSGALLSEIAAPGPGTGFGEAAAAGGDFDADGIADLIVTAGFPHPQGGRVHVIAGADGSVLRSFDGDAFGDGFGRAVAVVGDADGRGTPDVLVGAPLGGIGIFEFLLPAYARLYAGEDGAVLFDSGPVDGESRYGDSVAGLGDLDGDGRPEFAVGRPERPELPGSPAGSVQVYSGADGALLGSVPGAHGDDRFGASVVALGDADGDAVPDFAVGSPGFARGAARDVGRVVVISGATLSEIRSLAGRRAYEAMGGALAVSLPGPGGGPALLAVGSAGRDGRGAVTLHEIGSWRRVRTIRAGVRVGFGERLAGPGDVDGDGFPDVAATSTTVGDFETADGASLVEAFSGRTGTLLFSRRGRAGDAFGLSFACGGDRDEDGRDELLVGVPAAEAVAVFRVLPGVVHPVVRVALQRTGEVADPDVHGVLETGSHAPSQPLGVTIRGLEVEPPSGRPRVFLEDAVGSGSFLDLGETAPVLPFEGEWVLGLGTSGWVPPPALRFSGPEDLAGCRVEVREPAGAVILRVRLPGSPAPRFSGKSGLLPPIAGPRPKARGTVRVRSSSKSGAAGIRTSTRGLAAGTEYRLWVEDGPSSGAFVDLGPLVGGRLALASDAGDALPGAAPDGPSMSGRLLEVRDGAQVVLEGVLP